MSTPLYPPKPKPGDRVAIVSPSAGLPELFPIPYELGLQRLRDDFGLIPVEYPTTRKMDSSAADRAADLHSAFGDPEIRAVFASIGGDDQLTVLKHLDPELLRANPKPFFGFSDCTNLLAYLNRLGIVGYHGGAIMTAFGRSGAMNSVSVDSLRAALFESGPYRLTENNMFGDLHGKWEDPATFACEPPVERSTGWDWHNADTSVTGHGWGGCLEIVAWLLMSDVAVPPIEYFDGAVLFFETTEELPSAEEVYGTMRCIGERGILGRAAALLMARPMTRNHGAPVRRPEYASQQRDSVLRAMEEYAPGVPVVTNIDFGHTDPQSIIPYGGLITVDGPARRITVTY